MQIGSTGDDDEWDGEKRNERRFDGLSGDESEENKNRGKKKRKDEDMKKKR